MLRGGAPDVGPHVASRFHKTIMSIVTIFVISMLVLKWPTAYVDFKKYPMSCHFSFC